MGRQIKWNQEPKCLTFVCAYYAASHVTANSKIKTRNQLHRNEANIDN